MGKKMSVAGSLSGDSDKVSLKKKIARSFSKDGMTKGDRLRAAEREAQESAAEMLKKSEAAANNVVKKSENAVKSGAKKVSGAAKNLKNKGDNAVRNISPTSAGSSTSGLPRPPAVTNPANSATSEKPISSPPPPPPPPPSKAESPNKSNSNSPSPSKALSVSSSTKAGSITPKNLSKQAKNLSKQSAAQAKKGAQ